MKRRDGRSVPLEALVAEFLREEPPFSDVAAHEEWTTRRYAAAAAAGYSSLEVMRALRPRPAPSKRRPS